jgi:uncharacterized protein
MIGNPNQTFLTAQWKHLAIINYLVDPDALYPYVPAGTELDLWNNKCYLSIVGFRFLNTKIIGIYVPYHKDFEEINLRFYVFRINDGEIRRGVVFIKEIVPKKLVALVANKLYKENYITLRTRCSIDMSEESLNRHASYSWYFKNRWDNISLTPRDKNYLPAKGSEAEFITEHYWGYSLLNTSTTLEYQVRHPKWAIWDTSSVTISVNLKRLYGSVLAEYLSQDPHSAFIVEGSEVSVSCSKKYIF